MSIETQSGTISRKKLQDLTGDHETTKYLENLQRDIVGPVTSGIDGAQSVADQAQLDATAAQSAANAAQAAATQAASAAAAAQAAANLAQQAANSAQSDATYARGLAETINADYVSKAATGAQSVAGSFQATSYRIAGVQVVGARQTGWTASTGTANKGAFAADTVYAASAAYTQTEAAAAYTALQQARQRILALEIALRNHGLIN